MNDLIARARETWCRWGSPEREGDLIPELARKLGLEGHYRNTYVPCPPEVVAALLNALEVSIDSDGCPDCGRTQWQEHSSDCRVAATYRAIEKALEARE